jgi:monovalent cation/hydrogen antiporter
VLAFILVGLQLKHIVQRLSEPQLVSYLAAAALVCVAVIVVRVLWVALYELAGRWARAHFAARLDKPARHPSPRAAVLVAWCGMRGTVTLAAALALPVSEGERAGFPHRDFILFTAFCVVLVTLVLQGMTLTPLIRRLALDDDGAVEHEVLAARATVARAGLEALGEAEASDDDAGILRRKYELRVRRIQAAKDSPEAESDEAAFAPLRRALYAERLALSDLRTRGVIGDDAFHRVEEELDWAELNASSRMR